MRWKIIISSAFELLNCYWNFLWWKLFSLHRRGPFKYPSKFRKSREASARDKNRLFGVRRRSWTGRVIEIHIFFKHQLESSSRFLFQLRSWSEGNKTLFIRSPWHDEASSRYRQTPQSLFCFYSIAGKQIKSSNRREWDGVMSVGKIYGVTKMNLALFKACWLLSDSSGVCWLQPQFDLVGAVCKLRRICELHDFYLPLNFKKCFIIFATSRNSQTSPPIPFPAHLTFRWDFSWFSSEKSLAFKFLSDLTRSRTLRLW